MSGLSLLRSTNLREIELLREILSIEGTGRGVKVASPPSPTCPKEVSLAIRQLFDSQGTRNRVMGELLSPAKGESRCFYWGPARPTAVDLFLARMALLGHFILIEDPLVGMAYWGDESGESPIDQPSKWVKLVVEHGLYLASLEEWVKAGIVSLVPPIHVWNPRAWVELAQLGQQLFSPDDPEAIEVAKWGAFDLAVDDLLTSFELAKAYGLDARTRDSLGVTTAEDERRALEQLRRLPRDEAAKLAASIVHQSTSLPPQVVEEYLAVATRRPFDFPESEQIGISSEHPESCGERTRCGYMGFAHCVPPAHAVYLAEVFDCIPTSDRTLDWLALHLWQKKIGLARDQKERIERLRASTDLGVELLNDVPLDFVLSTRQRGYAAKLRSTLESRWDCLRSARSAEEFERVSEEFRSQVRADYEQFKGEWQDVRTEALHRFGAAGISGLGVFAAAQLTMQPIFVQGTAIAGLLAAVAGIGLTKERKSRALSRNPLYVFLRLEHGKRTV